MKNLFYKVCMIIHGDNEDDVTIQYHTWTSCEYNDTMVKMQEDRERLFYSYRVIRESNKIVVEVWM